MNAHHKLSNKSAIKSIIMLKKLTESEEIWYPKSHSAAAVLEDCLGHSMIYPTRKKLRCGRNLHYTYSFESCLVPR